MKKIFKKILTFFKELFIKISEFFRLKVSTFLAKVFKFIGKYTGISFLLRKYNERFSNKTKKAVIGYLLIAPWIIGLIIFGIQPIANSIRMALSNFAATTVQEGPNGATRVFTVTGWSFAQFKQIFNENPEHVETIISTFLDILIVVPLVLVFSLVLSLLLNRKVKGIKIFRMIFFIPVILLSGNLLGYFGSYDLLVVPALESAELQSTLLFYFPESVVDIILNAFGKIILILWFSGVQTLIFLAGLQKTNKPVYEAAAIDGANRWEMFWKITFPSLMPLIIINIIYTTVIYSNTGNALTRLISQTIAPANYGRDYASALSWIMFGIELAIIGIYVLIFTLANRKYTR